MKPILFLSTIVISCKDGMDIPKAKTERTDIEEQSFDNEFVCYFPPPPSFIGGQEAMVKYISKHLKIDTSEATPTIKIFQGVPKWNPGEIGDLPKIRMTIPIRIDLN